MMLALQDSLFSASLAVYLTASVFVAAVRWGHRCQPYGKHMDYYHPAWKTVIFCFLCNLLMAPVIFMPTDTDAVLQLRLFLILASPYFCAVALFSYFGNVLKVNTWRRPVFILSVPFGAMVLSATVLAFVPGTQMTPQFCRWYFSLGGLLALAFLFCFVSAIVMVARQLRRSAEEKYSNPDDFPQKFAAKVIWIPFLHLAASWVGAFVGTPQSLSITLLVLSALSLAFLIGILSPHRDLTVEQLEAAEAPEPPAQEESALPEDRQDEIEKAIRHLVEQDQAYLDSHLLLDDVASRIGVNSKYVSLVMKSRLGGFFSYINRCRLSHAARLQVEHPEMPIGEVIADSGFGSRTTYYKVRKQLEER